MKTAAPGYTRRRPPNGHSRSYSQEMTLRATPSLTGSGPWPLVTRKEPLARIVAAALPRGEHGSGRGCR